jgi:hypothetical protein
MSEPPPRPKIYHITHVDNLAAIAASECLLSDRAMLDRDEPAQLIGMGEIKRRRVEQLEVHCHPGTKVGDYVPFYYCPRSVMLYVLHCANHPELTYRGGQGPIVHLEADLHAVIRWTEEKSVRWAIALSNAGARYTEFRASVGALHELDWESIASRDFRPADVQERKQAEFLVHESFPFALVERIGVQSESTRISTATALRNAKHVPAIEVRPEWYF